MVRNPFFSQFRIIKIFAFRTDRQTDRLTKGHTLLCGSAQEQQIWKIISREIFNLSLNVKFCISKNMAFFLCVFRTGPCS